MTRLNKVLDIQSDFASYSALILELPSVHVHDLNLTKLLHIPKKAIFSHKVRYDTTSNFRLEELERVFQ